MPKIKFLRENREIEVEPGTNLRKAAQKAGISVYQGPTKFLNCLGNGLCGTCLVYVEEGIENCSNKGLMESINLNCHPLTIMHKIGKEDVARLSCQTSVNGDITVDTKPTLNLYGERDHEYTRILKGEQFVEFPDHPPRGVKEKQKRDEEGTAKDWFHKNRSVKTKSNTVEVEDEEEEVDEGEEDSN